MENPEGRGQSPPSLPFLAYADAEVDRVVERQDSADGDVAEATYIADIQTLQRQLNERELETERARRNALELRNELEAAKAEAAALKEVAESTRGAPVSGQPPAPARAAAERDRASQPDAETASRIVSDAFAELAKVRTESFKARKEIERERDQHRAEMIRARGQYASAQEELQRLIKVRKTVAAPVPRRDSDRSAFVVPVESSEGRAHKVLGAAALAGLLVGIVLLWPRVSIWSKEHEMRPAVMNPEPVQAGRGVPLTAAETGLPLTPASRAQFQGEVARLSRVLASKPGRAPEELLRQAHQLYRVTEPSLCAFDWRNGQPSLLYSGGHLSLGQTIQRCADAIEKIP